jgi:hypothetical protein
MPAAQAQEFPDTLSRATQQQRALGSIRGGDDADLHARANALLQRVQARFEHSMRGAHLQLYSTTPTAELSAVEPATRQAHAQEKPFPTPAKSLDLISEFRAKAKAWLEQAKQRDLLKSQGLAST